MTDFQSNGCVVFKNFIDPVTIKTISQYMENKVRLSQWTKRPELFTYEKDPSSLLSYADPLIEVLLKDSVQTLEEITGLELYPTYSYARIYLKGDELTPHTDRPSCEVSVTVNVATVGKPWPIWMQVPGQDPIKVEMEPGDAVVYKGCEVTHWREKMVDADINVQFMMHYVNKNGPYADYKWDKRPGLGYVCNLRSN
jgi:hypothetical protein